MISSFLRRTLIQTPSLASLHYNNSKRLSIPTLRTFTMTTTPSLDLALCQISVGRDKEANIVAAKSAVFEAASKNSKLIVLPECFNCPYSTADFPEYAEYIPEVNSSEEYEGTVASLSSWAKELGIYIVGGSIPERSLDGKIYNTSTVFDSNGLLIAKHRKLHLFDIDIPGKMTFKESDSLSPGNEITLFDMKLQPNVDANEAGSTVRVGLGICYDIRFSEYAQSCAYNGAKLLIYPGAFNLVTGPAHWELLQKCRAVDNQVYVAGCSPARAPESDPGYKAWGHSTIVSPWGDVVGKCAAEASIVYGSLDFVRLEEIRNQIPITKQRRYDVYPHPHKLTQNKA